MKTIIKNGLVVTFIHEGYHSIKMKYADILIEGDQIAEIRESIEAPEGEAVRIIDAQGKMVLPGLVNIGSNCIASQLLNGLLPDYSRYNWQGSMVYHRVLPMLKIADEILTGEEKYILARWAMEKAVESGSTTLVDLNRPGFAGAAEKAARELGLRAWVVTQRTAGEFPYAAQDGRLICEEPVGGSFAGESESLGGVTRLDGLYSVETTSPAMWETVQKGNKPLFLYGAYSKLEEQFCHMHDGKSPIAKMGECGALTPRTTVLNSFYTDFFDRERLRTAGANVALSAVAAMQDALEFPIVTMLKQDINTALCTGYFGMSMLEEMKAAAYGAKLEAGMAQQYQASDAFYAATIAGAKALDEPIGRIEQGYCADLLIVNMDRFRPVNYPLIHFVYSAQPQDIEMVLAGGKVIFTNSVYDRQRIAEMASKAQKIAEKVWAKARETIL